MLAEPQRQQVTQAFERHVAAVYAERFDSYSMLDGPMSGQSFFAYVEQVLIPTLQPDDIVVIDNLMANKTAAVCAGSVGAQLFLLPPYSLDTPLGPPESG
jgi:hypothetical protein